MGGFGCGLAGWAFILFEIFAGESANACGDASVSDAVKQSFNNMRIIVSLGWCIYPLGYFFGVLQGTADEVTLNVVYNIADFVNKIAFVLACWSLPRRTPRSEWRERSLALSFDTVKLACVVSFDTTAS